MFIDKSTGVEMEQLVEPQSLLDLYLSGLPRSTRNSALVLSSSPPIRCTKVSAASVVSCVTIDFTNLVSVEDEFYSNNDDI